MPMHTRMLSTLRTEQAKETIQHNKIYETPSEAQRTTSMPTALAVFAHRDGRQKERLACNTSDSQI